MGVFNSAFIQALIQILDEGIFKGLVNKIDFVGDNVVATVVDDTATITILPPDILINILEDGIFEGLVDSLNFEGAGVDITVVGDTATITIPGGGGGGGSATTIEVDLGPVLVWNGKFTITDASITPTSKILAWQAPGPYTGKGTLADEAVLQPVRIIAVEPGTGSAVVYWETPPMTTFNKQSLMQFLNSGVGAINHPKDNFNIVNGVSIRLNKVRGNVKFTYMVLT